jgi:hypothetical protein
VELLVSQPTGDSAMDWYLEQFPGGGTMIVAEGFGNVFLAATEYDEDLEFVARKEAR